MGGRAKSIALISAGALAGVTLSLGISAWAFRDSRTAIPLSEIKQFSDVFERVKQNYVDPIDDATLMRKAISGMLSELDPHSAFLDAEAYKELRTSIKGEFGGLGIEVGTEDGFVRVISPIDDTPAARAGVQAGDLIIKVDDTLLRGMTLTDAVKLMRGPENTKVTLTLGRKGAAQPIVVPLTRAVIKTRSVRSQPLENGYGYIRISQFLEPTVTDFVKHYNGLAAKGNLKGLVLDLRNDPGGTLDAAIGISAAFLPRDVVVVSTNGQAQGARQVYLATPKHYAYASRGADPLAELHPSIKSIPVVVLVNNASASAAEIVAGALRDHKRGVVMGTQTFGKGSVQTIIPLQLEEGMGGLKLTTWRYYTPSGDSIQVKGITPNIVVEDTADGNFAGLAVREADLARRIDGRSTAGAAAPAATPAVERRETQQKRYELGSADDYQLRQAMNHLQGKPLDVAPTKRDTVAAAPKAAAK